MSRAYDLYQVAEALHLSHWTLRKHVKLGSIRVTRCGNRIRVNDEELARLLRDGLPSLSATQPQPDAA